MLKMLNFINFRIDSRIPASGRKRKRNTRESPTEILLKKEMDVLKSKLDSLNDNVLRQSNIITQGLDQIINAINANVKVDNSAVENKNNCMLM